MDAISSLISALPLPAMLIGPTERIEAMNAKALALFGTEGQGRHYITALRQPAVLDAVEQTLRDAVTRTSRFLGTEGGRDTTWRVTVAAVALQTGRGVLLCFEDITAVEEAGKMRRDFVANVSHELRTPLTALLGFVETLKGAARNDPAARDRFLDIMAREAGRMARLVDDLLSLSRVEEDERVRPVEQVDLCAVIDGVVATMAGLAASMQVVLKVDRPHDRVIVPGDPGQLRQVVTNLVENAMKYGGANKQIEIELTKPGPEPSLRSDGIRITVSDHGEGIEEHHIPRLTERFYRVDSHRSRDVGGTGLGLAIVKHIVNRHRGRMRVESRLGHGTRFIVILPVH